MKWISAFLGLALVTLAVGVKATDLREEGAGFARLSSHVTRAMAARTLHLRELLREIAAFSTQAIRWALGERLFSLSTAWMSLALSLAFFLFWLLTLLLFSPTGSRGWPAMIWQLPLAIVIALTVGLLSKVHRQAAKVLWCLLVTWAIGALSTFKELQPYSKAVTVGMGLVWLCGAAGNVLAASVLLSRLSPADSQPLRIRGTAVVGTYCLAVGAALAPIALLAACTIATPLGAWMRSSAPQFAATSLVFTCAVGAANAVTASLLAVGSAIVASSLFRRIALIVVGKLVSPPILRRLFRVQRPTFWVGILLLLAPLVAALVPF